MPKSMGNDFDEIALLLNPGDKTQVLGIHVETNRAYNIDKPYHPKDNNWLGYKLYLKGYSIYVCGDTDYVPELKNIKCDILFVPIGGKFTMDYKEAARFTNDIKPKYVIPIHYGSIVGSLDDFDKFKELIDKDIEVIRRIYE
jgi:L-ascorbate metabolism protein UlaG (beta-lactamase superfamily)